MEDNIFDRVQFEAWMPCRFNGMYGYVHAVNFDKRQVLFRPCDGDDEDAFWIDAVNFEE
jgi:hypothetical protein